ncbi:MAG TPA: polyprenyl synthetase family protein [Actinomycetota bacterium]
MSRTLGLGLEVPDAALEAELRERLDRVEEALRDAVRSDSPLVTEAAGYLLRAGGKRFRPLLLLLGGFFGDRDEPKLISGAVAVELTHLASLYHDDVIDEADARRGIPSANARWDNTVAILTGDYLFARSSAIGAELGPGVSRLLADTIGRVSEGQIHEVEAAGRVDIDEATYLDVIDRKTASLIATACRLGGTLAGAPTDQVEALERFGRALGLAFQLSDDIMDLTSDQATLGKEPGVDLKEGVYTLPVILALRDSDHRDELRDLLGPEPPTGERFARARDIVRSDGAMDTARDAVSAQVRAALAEAGHLPSASPRDALEHLAGFLAARCGAGP